MTLENEFERKTKQNLTEDDLRLLNVAQRFLAKYGIFKAKEIFDTPIIDFLSLKQTLVGIVRINAKFLTTPTKLEVNKYELEYVYEPCDLTKESNITNKKLFDLMIAVANDIKNGKKTSLKRIVKEFKVDANSQMHECNMILLNTLIEMEKQRKELLK